MTIKLTGKVCGVQRTGCAAGRCFKSGNCWIKPAYAGGVYEVIFA